jgi:cyanophycinase-like exopeptidase
MNRFTKLIFVMAAAALLTAATVSAQDDAPTPGTWVPVGGGYTTLHGFVEAALPYWETLDTDRFYALMLPMSFTYDPATLTTTDLLDNSWFIDRRRWQLEEACRDVMEENSLDADCRVVAPPIYTREAAEDELALDFFADDLAAVYFPGGDQVFAMQITAGTPLETTLAEAFERGVVMGGNSAGLAMQAVNMIAGYGEEYDENTALQEGAVVLWNNADGDERGLSFGVENVLLEQHLWEFVRTPRLLNYLALADSPDVAIGVDGYTAGILRDETTFGEIFGDYSAAVFDAATLGAADNANFDYVNFDGNAILSMHNVLVHVLPPGDFSYDIPSRAPSQADLLTEVDRSFDLSLPDSAGMLLLGGADARSLHENLADASIAIVVTGYPEDELQAVAESFEGYYVIPLGEGDSLDGQLDNIQFISVYAGDQTLLNPEQLAPVRDAWLNGANVSLMGAAAALAGPEFAANPPVDYDNDESDVLEAHDQGSFILGNTNIQPGLGLIKANVEPSLIDNNRFGRLFALAYNNPAVLAVGIPSDASVQFNSDGVFVPVHSGNGVFVLDLSQAALDLGENDAFAFANGLLDVFAPGETLEAVNP